MKLLHAYGPVPSRRLGNSVGISPIPQKFCTYSCVYCQLGRTDNLTIERRKFYEVDEIIDDLVAVTRGKEYDFITIAGDGEPTLYSELGILIDRIKSGWNKPLALITNGSLLYREDVRNDLSDLDVIMPSLDSADNEIYKKISRPHKLLDFDKMYKGLKKFSYDFSGEIWLEIMLVRGLNDSVEYMKTIAELVSKINVARIYLNIPIRPPAESFVLPPEPEKLILAKEIFSSVFKKVHVLGMDDGDFGVGGFKNAEEAILSISSRHPLRYEQGEIIEKKFGEKVIERMLNKNKLYIKTYHNTKYIIPTKNT